MKIKWARYDITRQISHASLAIFFANTSYIDFATAQTPRTFDYDPDLLPDVAEALFALRIKHVNIGEPFVVNMSGNYLLQFTKDRIGILDTYTKNSDVYKYQSDNPNITIGLGVSKGLPSNYKSIIIKEDANGQLYNYAALHSDNIITDETMLSDTLSHPFYQITGKNGVENKVPISQEMVFYYKRPSHERHARCVNSKNESLIEDLKDIFSSGSNICGPKPDSGIFTASHNSAKNMKLEEKLVEATVAKGKDRQTVGFKLELSLDPGENTVALLNAAQYCKESITGWITKSRHKRAPGFDDCRRWVFRLVELYMRYGFKLHQVYDIVQKVLLGQLEGQRPGQQEFEEIIIEHKDEAVSVLKGADALVSQAALEDSAFLNDGESTGLASAVQVQNSVAEGKLGAYTVVKDTFRPLPNVARILDSDGEEAVDYEPYDVIVLDMHTLGDGIETVFAHYIEIMNRWIKKIKKMMESASIGDRTQLELALSMTTAIHDFLDVAGSDSNLVVGAVHHRGSLIAINIGYITGNQYWATYGVVSPDSILRHEGAHTRAAAYLTSEVLNRLFKVNRIDSAFVYTISKYAASPTPTLGFKHHDEL